MSLKRMTGLALLLLCGVLVTDGFGQVPTISVTEPLGLRPGQTNRVKIRGGNLAGVSQVWASFGDGFQLAGDIENNGTNAAEATFDVEVPASTGVGVHALRVATPGGVSSLRLMLVDDLPAAVQDKANISFEKAQVVEQPVAIDGVVDSLARNFYRFKAEAGQTLSFEVVARRMGTALDPMLRLLDADGRELKYSDDAPGLSGDAQFSYRFETAGDYLVEVRDIRFQGGGNHQYRLRIGDFPCVSVPYPLGGQRGQSVKLSFAGQDVEGVEAIDVAVPGDPLLEWVNVGARRANGNSHGFATLAVSDTREFTETEPNDGQEKANRIESGWNVNGRFEKAGDVDWFAFTGRKGQKLVFEAVTRQQGTPVDLLLQVWKMGGGKLAEADDNGVLDGRLVYALPEDGEYALAVSDLHRRGGDLYAYRVVCSEDRPGFSLTASADSVNIPAGATASVTVSAARANFGGAIEVSCTDLPAGISCSTTTMGPGRNSVELILHSAADAASSTVVPIRVVGTGQNGDQEIEATASIQGVLKAKGNAMPWAPLTLEHKVALGVAPALPFSLRIEPAQIVFGKNLKASVKVIATRTDGHNAQIDFKVRPEKDGLPGGVSAALKPIPADQNEVTIEFSANDKVALGEFTAVLSGTLKKDKSTWSLPTPGIGLKLTNPVSVNVPDAPAPVGKGAKVGVTVQVGRIAAFSGPVALSVKNLPAGVTAGSTMVAAEANSASIELTVAEDAATGSFENLVISAEATVGNVKSTVDSAPVTLTIQ